jgi:hypothetical protein
LTRAGRPCRAPKPADKQPVDDSLSTRVRLDNLLKTKAWTESDDRADPAGW